MNSPKKSVIPICLLLLLAIFSQLMVVFLFENIKGYLFYLVIFLLSIFIITLLRWPENILYLITLIFPFQSFSILDFTIQKTKTAIAVWPIDITAFIAGMALLAKLNSNKTKNLYVAKSYNLPMFVLCSFSVLSLFWVENLRVGLYSFIKLIACVLLFYAPIVLINSKEQLKRIVYFLFLAGTIMAIGGIFSTIIKANKETITFVDIELGNYLHFVMSYFIAQKARALGFAYSNFLAFFLSLSFICGLYVLTQIRKGVKIILILVILIIILYLYAEINTLSRGGLVAFAAGVTFFIFTNIKTRFDWPKYFLIFLFVVIVVLLIFSMLKLSGGFGRLEASITSERLVSSWGTRMYIWERGLKEFLDSYGLGTGIGGLISLTPYNLYAHNAYLGTLFELGVIGFFMYLLIHYIFISQAKFFKILSCKDFNPLFTTFASILIVWLLHSLIEFDYYLLRIPWFILGLSVATIKLKSIQERGACNEGF